MNTRSSKEPLGFDVIVCGSLHLDIVVHAPALPRIDETAVGTAWRQVCGGKGGNQAVQAARAGARTAMIGRIGRDGFGDALRANLQRSGVNDARVATDESAGSGMSIAILRDDGEYGAVIVSGANLAIDPSKLAEDWSALRGANVLVLQNEVPPTINTAAARVAREHGAAVILNAAPARGMPHDMLSLIDVLVVNRVEAEAMSSTRICNREDAMAAMRTLAASETSVVVTLGGQGVVVGAKGTGVVEIEACPVKVRSAHGAGDCFVGVLAAQLAAAIPLVEACHTANRDAAAFVSRGMQMVAQSSM